MADSFTCICRPLRDFLEDGQIRRRVGLCRFEVRQMIEHDPQLRHLVVIATIASSSVMRGLAVSSTRSASASSLRPSMNAGFGPAPRCRVPIGFHIGCREQRVLAVAIEVFLELGLVRLEVADDATMIVSFSRDFQYPEVVLEPRARLDLDRADRASGRQLAIAVGISRNRRLTWHARAAVRRALRTSRSNRWMCVSMMGMGAPVRPSAGASSDRPRRPRRRQKGAARHLLRVFVPSWLS